MLTLEEFSKEHISALATYQNGNHFVAIYPDGTKVKEGKYNLFVIEEDLVEEQYIGTETRYNHKITLVEVTKLLETELMPNMTFTQPVRVIGIDPGTDFLRDDEIVYGPDTIDMPSFIEVVKK